MFLGLLRQALPAWMRAAIVAEVAKDLVHEDVEAIIRHLPHLPHLPHLRRLTSRPDQPE